MSKTTTKKNSKNFKNEEIHGADDFQSAPGNDVINNILNFSKALSIKKLKNDSCIELVLN